MVGGPTKRLIRKGKYPRCLSDAFAAVHKDKAPRHTRDPMSPWEAYWYQRWARGGAIGLGAIACVALFLGLGMHAGIENGWGLVFTGFVFFIFSIVFWIDFFTPGWGGPGDLRAFEKSLADVMNLLTWQKKGSRESHMLYVGEAKEQARKALVYFAFSVLAGEREEGPASMSADAMRTRFKQAHLLFQEYGLIDRSDEYRPFYEEAKKMLDERDLAKTTAGA